MASPGRAVFALLWLSAEVLLSTGKKAAKHPVVKWGQKPERLYITVLAPNVEEPEVVMEEKRISFKGWSRGEEIEVNLPLLRKINVTGSKREINDWSVSFDLMKSRKEPCWKRLMKSTKQPNWLKKDYDHWYTDQCQYMKEQWRETYFTAKMDGKDPSSGKEPEPQDEVTRGNTAVDDMKSKEKADFQARLKELRERAIPRKSSSKENKGAKGKKNKGGKKSEL
eukprot:gnl/TRDRNA2_/TRDRNA2_184117_c0_seq1.p1 gnl/TRDRNA2_/TRDRNA2_184117_c0~~gnl/TRDRNA2_/TRDRNA2_184117_c0_seq1.p1  ORF type:complete len:224 (-),score=64.70 gnl/TRDRNA2_/TRDRNA2_184117_c0_seq1:112-783(-)